MLGDITLTERESPFHGARPLCIQMTVRTCVYTAINSDLSKTAREELSEGSTVNSRRVELSISEHLCRPPPILRLRSTSVRKNFWVTILSSPFLHSRPSASFQSLIVSIRIEIEECRTCGSSPSEKHALLAGPLQRFQITCEQRAN